jgi:hypothetical protein
MTMDVCTMYDSVDVSKLPADATAYAAYVNGDYANHSEVKARFPKARVFGIDVLGTDWQDASILDYEPGNPCYTTDRLIEFACGREDFRPYTTCIYCNRADLPTVEDTLTETWHVIFLATLDGTKMTGTRTPSGNLIVATQYESGTITGYDTSEVLTSWVTGPAPWM